MAFPVVTVASGGLAVADVTATTPAVGMPVTEATNGRGMAVTKVTAGRPGLAVNYVANPVITGPAVDFLTRTSGLDATHTNAYYILITGLVSAGVWSKLDVLHIYATQNTTTAQLNLVQTSYPATLNGAPTFTADRGYTGTDASTTKFINTSFNASTAPSPKFTQNSAHLSVWNIDNPAGGMNGAAMGTATPGSGFGNFIQPQNTTGNCLLRCNTNSQADASITTGTGHHVANRSGANAREGYRNSGNVQTITGGGNAPSITVQNGNIYTLGHNNLDAAAAVGSGYQLAMASIGSSLTPTDVIYFYTLLRNYMTAVGVP